MVWPRPNRIPGIRRRPPPGFVNPGPIAASSHATVRFSAGRRGLLCPANMSAWPPRHDLATRLPASDKSCRGASHEVLVPYGTRRSRRDIRPNHRPDRSRFGVWLRPCGVPTFARRSCAMSPLVMAFRYLRTTFRDLAASPDLRFPFCPGTAAPMGFALRGFLPARQASGTRYALLVSRLPLVFGRPGDSLRGIGCPPETFSRGRSPRMPPTFDDSRSRTFDRDFRDLSRRAIRIASSLTSCSAMRCRLGL